MIIKTDVKNLSLDKAAYTRKTPDIPLYRNIHENTPPSTKSISDRLSVERSLGDALSIAQMSQNVIQKALSISSRLKGIAAAAMATGSVNTQALNEALNDIRSTMEVYGEKVPSPMQPGAAPSAKIIEIPDMRGALSSVRDIAGTLEKGGYNQSDRIDAAARNLNELLTKYRIAENRITDIMRETAAGYAPATPARSRELLGQITAAITSNPDYALSVQGNINHTVAERLMA
ncbi:MAG: hypothetical protein KA369_00550 [Spirochaetes bacterium]|nr:hypothetical protein [Spirochaetota bacterium]